LDPIGTATVYILAGICADLKRSILQELYDGRQELKGRAFNNSDG
jgi:hypothetical protein